MGRGWTVKSTQEEQWDEHESASFAGRHSGQARGKRCERVSQKKKDGRSAGHDRRKKLGILWADWSSAEDEWVARDSSTDLESEIGQDKRNCGDGEATVRLELAESGCDRTPVDARTSAHQGGVVGVTASDGDGRHFLIVQLKTNAKSLLASRMCRIHVEKHGDETTAEQSPNLERQSSCAVIPR